MNKKMKKLFSITSVVLLVLSLVVVSIGAEPKRAKAAENVPQYRNVMYYGDWSIWGGEGNFYPKDIPADQLTHLNFAFLDFNSNGDLVFTDKDAAVGRLLGKREFNGAEQMRAF